MARLTHTYPGMGPREAKRVLPALVGEVSGGARTDIALVGCGLTTVPEALRGLTGLRRLDLSGNRITSVPAWLGELSGLDVLDLRENRLAELPDELAGLARLRVLDLGHNRLGTLPGAVSRLTGLDFLKVDGNRLGALPDAVAGLTGLSWLDARHNRLKVLPAELRGMGRLDYLDLAGNALATVPDSIGALSGLSILDLSRNRLATLPDAIGELSRLKVLRLADNQLTALPPAVCRIAGLEALVVGRNRLTTVPEAIGALTKLVKLDLSDNLLDGTPAVLADLPELAVLELDGNPGHPRRPPPYEMPETAGRSELFQLVVSGLLGWAGSQGGKDGLDANSYAVSQLRRLAGAERTMAEDLAIGLLSTGNTAGARALVEARCTRAVSVLRALATSTTEAPERRLGAARGLAVFDPAAGRAVAIEILRDATLHWRVRTEAIRILAAHRGGDAEAALAEAASDPVEKIRSAAKGVLRAPGSWG